MSKFRDKFFSLDNNVKSPLCPIIRAVVCIIFIVLAIMRDEFLPELSGAVEIILAVACYLLTVFAVLRIYISCMELLEYYWRKMKRK